MEQYIKKQQHQNKYIKGWRIFVYFYIILVLIFFLIYPIFFYNRLRESGFFFCIFILILVWT